MVRNPKDRFCCDEAHFFLSGQNIRIHHECEGGIEKYFYYFLTDLDQIFLKIFCEEINSFLAGDNYCCLLITFANSLDPDQDP